MKKMIFVSACVMALSAGGALAQSQPTSGASSEGNVGPGAAKGSTQMDKKKGMTTGAAKDTKGTAANPSSSGNVGPGTNNNSGPQQGGR
jgi:hypothetical protein